MHVFTQTVQTRLVFCMHQGVAGRRPTQCPRSKRGGPRAGPRLGVRQRAAGLHHVPHAGGAHPHAASGGEGRQASGEAGVVGGAGGGAEGGEEGGGGDVVGGVVQHVRPDVGEEEEEAGPSAERARGVEVGVAQQLGEDFEGWCAGTGGWSARQIQVLMVGVFGDFRGALAWGRAVLTASFADCGRVS